MFFLLIRISPAVIAIVFYLALRSLSWFFDFWPWFLTLVVVLDFAFFFALNSKTKNRDIFWVFCHSLVFISIGFVQLLLLSNQLSFNLFLIGWAIIYGIYLESIFHHFYHTEQVELIDYNHVITYVNLVAFFFLVATLVNVNIFLGLAWWWLILIILPAGFILVFNRFLALKLEFKTCLSSALVITLILSELFGATLFLPSSFYVSAAVLSIAFYLLLSFFVLKFQGKLTPRLAVSYGVFSLLALMLVLATAAWA